MPVLRAILAVRLFFGYLMALAVGIAFLVLGHLAGRMIGAAILAYCAWVAVSFVRSFRRNHPHGRDLL